MVSKLAENTPLATVDKTPASPQVQSPSEDTDTTNEPSVSEIVEKVLNTPTVQQPQGVDKVEETKISESVPEYREASQPSPHIAVASTPTSAEAFPVQTQPVSSAAEVLPKEAAPVVTPPPASESMPANLPTQINHSVSEPTVDDSEKVTLPTEISDDSKEAINKDSSVLPQEIPENLAESQRPQEAVKIPKDVPEPALVSTPEPIKSEKEDESGLYSIRNFSV